MTAGVKAGGEEEADNDCKLRSEEAAKMVSHQQKHVISGCADIFYTTRRRQCFSTVPR